MPYHAVKIDETKRLTKIPHTILFQLMNLTENPGLMKLEVNEPDQKVLHAILQYSEALAVSATRTMTIVADRVVVDTWDLEWIKNPSFSVGAED